jgi:tRNA(Ile)-lysidine synthase
MTPTILRPLLHTSKREILEYAREHHISYREDSTNTDTTYLRNHLRCDILPEFEKINPEYRRSLEGFIGYSEELKEWIDRQVGKWLLDQTKVIRSRSKEMGSPYIWAFCIEDFT